MARNGWFRDSYRHSLASRGIRTSFKASRGPNILGTASNPGTVIIGSPRDLEAQELYFKILEIQKDFVPRMQAAEKESVESWKMPWNSEARSAAEKKLEAMRLEKNKLDALKQKYGVMVHNVMYINDGDEFQKYWDLKNKKNWASKGDIIPNNAIIKVPHNGKMVSGKVVRHDKGDYPGYSTPFYVVDVGEYESIKVPDREVEIPEGEY